MSSDRRRKLLLIAVAACLGFLAADRLIATPLTNLWRTNSARIAELRQDIDKGSRLEALGPALEAKWREMRAQSLPALQSVTENQVFSAVSGWAQETNLSVTSQKPRWILDQKDCRKLEIRLGAEGDLGAIARFLYALETAPLAQNVEEAQLTARDETGGKMNLGLRFTGLIIEEAKK